MRLLPLERFLAAKVVNWCEVLTTVVLDAQVTLWYVKVEWQLAFVSTSWKSFLCLERDARGLKRNRNGLLTLACEAQIRDPEMPHELDHQQGKTEQPN
jgi:hypothetical protein